jgi:integrase
MSAKISINYDKRNKKKPWVCRWDGDFNFDTGKSKRYAKSFRLKTEAETFAAQKTVEFERGGRRDKPQDITLSKFCKDWLHTRQSELRPTSLDCYVNTIRRLEDFFGKDCNLRDIDTKRAAVFIAEQQSRMIGHEGRELSDASREQIKRNCKCLFRTAVEWGLLAHSPFSTLHSKKLTIKRWHRLTVKEYFALLNATLSLREKVAYALLYTSGARMGEAFALTWDCIDFENGRLIIANREGTNTMPPFNIKDHEARRIPLPKHTIDLLTEWQAQAPEGVPYILLTKERYEIVKARWRQLRKDGKLWRNRYLTNNVLRNFRHHYKRAGIKPVGKLTIHTIRKCCGQNWADNLPMNVVKELMGHSNIATTQTYYTQVDSDHEAKAARVIQRLLENKIDVNLTYEPILGQTGDVQ